VPARALSSNREQVAQMCDQIASEHYDASEKPFDFIEEEGKTALVCETDPAIREAVSGPLKLLEYHLTLCDSARQALKNMRYHDYNLIVVDDLFDAANPNVNGVMIYLERLAMEVRRDIFVVLISRRCRSMDQMTALQNSVNLIVNQDDMADFGKILLRGISDFNSFYRPFKEIEVEYEES
jgi:CheY-like chemotaxis protein